MYWVAATKIWSLRICDSNLQRRVRLNTCFENHNTEGAPVVVQDTRAHRKLCLVRMDDGRARVYRLISINPAPAARLSVARARVGALPCRNTPRLQAACRQRCSRRRCVRYSPTLRLRSLCERPHGTGLKRSVATMAPDSLEAAASGTPALKRRLKRSE